MPRMSPSGVPAMGIGDGIISIGGVVPAPLRGVVGGGTCWLRDGTPIYQNDTNGIATLEILDNGVRKEVADRGANRLEAGGGVWAAWSSTGGYFDSLGRTSPSWYPLAVDDASGTVAVCLNYSEGRGLGLLPQSTSVPTILDRAVLDRIDEGHTSFREGVLAYRGGGAMRLYVLDPFGGASFYGASTLPIAGARQHRGFAVGWHDTHGLVLYRVGDTRGVSLSRDERDFNADIWVSPDMTTVRVVSSATAGERPEDLRTYVRDLPLLGTVDLKYVVVTLHPPLPVTPSRPLWRGLEGGGPFRAAGNATWGVVDERPFIESEPWVTKTSDLAQRRCRWLWFMPHNYSAADFGYPDVATYAAATAAASRRLGVPVVVYWDGPTYEGWAWLQWFEAQHLAVLRGVQCYPLAGEALGDTVWRITRVLTDHRSYRDTVVRPVYAPLGVDLVFRLQAHLDRLCNTFTHIVGDFGFGRSRRPECFDAWPDFQAYWTALCAATPVPVIPPAPLPPAPPALDPLMSALTLKRSKFVEGSYAADRGGKLYRLSNGKNMSIQEADGLPRSGGLPNNGPSETFFLKGDRAYVEFDDIRYTFLVAD